MIIFYTVFFLVMAAIVLGSGLKDQASRWLFCVLIQCSLGGVTIIAYELSHSDLPISAFLMPYWKWGLILAMFCGLYASQLFVPYTLFIFSLYYSGYVNERIMRQIRCVALIPVLVTSPLLESRGTYYDFNPVLLLMWAGPYQVGAALLLLTCCFTASDIRQQRSRILLFIFIGIPTIIDTIIIDTMDALRSSIPYQYQLFLPIFMLIVFLFGAVRYGLMGIKINIQKRTFQQSARVLTTGASAVNSTLANEVAKMKLLLEHSESDKTHRTENTDQINEVCDHILQLTHRIKERTGNFELKRELHSLRDLVSDAVELTKPLVLEKGIRVSLPPSSNVLLDCDRFHLTEALKAVLLNAGEAIDHNAGEITLRLTGSTRQVQLEIADNGAGIAPEIADQVFEPFFSIKRCDSHIGLGLSYALTVVQKHGGSLTIASEPNQGTTVTMRF